jgi:hypothetical protein
LDVDIQDPVEDYGQDCNFMLKIGKKSQECWALVEKLKELWAILFWKVFE